MKTNWGTSTDKLLNLPIAMLIVLLATASAAVAAEGFYLYKPEKTQSQKIPAPGEGVLTRTITIQRGDTLKKLSARYIGRSSFFPQILLFNRIKNPDLIMVGAQLQVPLTKQEATGAKREAEQKQRHTVHKGTHHREYAPSPHRIYGKGEARLFRSGIRAFRAGQYRRAIEIFDRYLAIYPDSPNAADVMLRRAECYERLAGE